MGCYVCSDILYYFWLLLVKVVLYNITLHTGLLTAMLCIAHMYMQVLVYLGKTFMSPVVQYSVVLYGSLYTCVNCGIANTTVFESGSLYLSRCFSSKSTELPYAAFYCLDKLMFVIVDL